MNTVCPKKLGLGFVLKVNSDDHNPVHMYCEDYDGNLITKILLTDKPTSENDIYVCDGYPELSHDQKKALLKWANSNNRLGLNNWLHALATWNDYHSDE